MSEELRVVYAFQKNTREEVRATLDEWGGHRLAHLRVWVDGSDGLGWVGFHTFRHTCATMLFRHGLNAKQVQMWLGHHSPAFTLATYVHLMPDDLPDPTFLDALTRSNPREESPSVAIGAAAR